MLKMLRLTSITLLCLAVTLGWASPIGILFYSPDFNANLNKIVFTTQITGKDLVERDPEYNPDLFEGDILGVLPGQKVGFRRQTVTIDQNS